jgi:hypothetical protein
VPDSSVNYILHYVLVRLQERQLWNGLLERIWIAAKQVVVVHQTDWVEVATATRWFQNITWVAHCTAQSGTFEFQQSYVVIGTFDIWHMLRQSEVAQFYSGLWRNENKLQQKLYSPSIYTIRTIQTYIQFNSIQYNTYNTIHIIQWYTIQYNAMQYNIIQYIQFNSIQYYTIQYNDIQYNTIQYIQFNSIQHIQCNAIQCITLHYMATQYNTIQ